MSQTARERAPCAAARTLQARWVAADDAEADAVQDSAVRAGALNFVGDLTPNAEYDSFFRQLERALAGAVRRHDAAPCAHAAACERCAVLRSRGKVCALPSCGARQRTDVDDAAKKLLRCARCEKAVYCCKPHQTADWAVRHKAECRKPEAGDGASGSAGA